jgi:hypothetical protein
MQSDSGPGSGGISCRSIAVRHEHRTSDEPVCTDTSRRRTAVSTITSSAEKGGFAAIAAGLKGIDQGIRKDINLFGCPAVALIKQAEKIVLWCCP